MNLVGKRVLITRPRKQAEEFADALMAEGARPVFFPVIRIIPPNDFSDLDFALQSLKEFDWLILTSVHAVDTLIKRLQVLGIAHIPSGLCVAAVGSKTVQALSERGIWVDYVPDEYIPEAILSGLGNNLHGKRFLLPLSNLARTVLADEIRSVGGVVTEVVVYRNVMNEPDNSALDELRAGVDVVTFTSPSVVNNFVAVLQKNGLDPFKLSGNPLCACIGPITKKAAEEAGFVNLIVAREYTTNGLIETLSQLVIHK